MAFTVRHEHFQGPLELLLSLIEKRKLHINDLALAKVADDFIAYVKSLGAFPIAESAHFVLIASTLLLIKSKSLLPGLALTDEEKGSIEDLEERLRVYQKIKELSVEVNKLVKSGKRLYPRGDMPIKPVFAPPALLTLQILKEAMHSVIQSFPKSEKELPKAAIKKIMSLEEAIENLSVRIQSALRMSFKEFAKAGKQEKVNVIVSFLALLELVKEGVISVTQNKHFEDIVMETEYLGVPKY